MDAQFIKGLRLLVFAVVSLLLWIPVVRADPPATESPGAATRMVMMVKAAYGAVTGIVRNSAKLPVAGAMVTATRTDGSSIRATLSGNDGLYSFADLPPGAWS